MTTDNSQCINFLDKKNPKFKKHWTHTFTSCTNQESEPRGNMLKSSAKKKALGYGTREWWVQTLPAHSLMQCSLAMWERNIGTWSFLNLSDGAIQTTPYILKLFKYFYHVRTFDQLHVQSEVMLSQKFWSGEKSGSGDQYSRKNGPPGPFSPVKIGLDLE